MGTIISATVDGLIAFATLLATVYGMCAGIVLFAYLGWSMGKSDIDRDKIVTFGATVVAMVITAMFIAYAADTENRAGPFATEGAFDLFLWFIVYLLAIFLSAWRRTRRKTL